MSKPLYSKNLGISTDDISKCMDPFQLTQWYLSISRDCIMIKDGIEFMQLDNKPENDRVLQKRRSALRTQLQMLKEIQIRHNEVKHGVYPNISEFIYFFNVANEVLEKEVIDSINHEVMKRRGIVNNF